MNETTKVCNDCKIEKPVSEFTFRNRKGGKGYYNAYCKPCNSRRTIESNKKHAEKRKAYNKEYRKKNLEKFKVWEKQARRKQLEKNPNFYKDYYHKNKERLNAHHRKWYYENKEHYAELQRKYREKRKQLPPALKEVIKLLNQLEKAIKNYGKE